MQEAIVFIGGMVVKVFSFRIIGIVYRFLTESGLDAARRRFVDACLKAGVEQQRADYYADILTS